MEDCELIMLISTIACAVTKCCTEDEISLMSVVFTQLGDTFATYLTQKQIREKEAGSKDSDNGVVNKKVCQDTDCNQLRYQEKDVINNRQNHNSQNEVE